MASDKQKKKSNSNEKSFDLFRELRAKIQTDLVNNTKIPSIIEFIDDKKYLGLPFLNPPINPYPLQKLTLKCFYRGSEGNENLVLTDADKLLINENGLNAPENGALIDKWEAGHDFRELVLVWGRRCLSESCEIVDVKTGRNWTLGELWNYGKLNLDSWTYDETAQTMTVMNNCNLIFQGVREVYQIQTTTGHEIEVTDNHPMLTDKGWVELKSLKPKDKIAVAACQPFFGSSTEITEDEASLLGYLSSECCDSVGAYIATTLKDGEVFDNFKDKLKSTSTDLKIEAAANYNLKSIDERKYSYVATTKAVSTKSNVVNVATILKNNGLHNKTGMQKFVPAKIFLAPKAVVAAYLRCLFSCDGSLTASKSSRYTSKIEASFSSLTLIKQVQHLLSRFGIFAGFQSKIMNGKPEHILSVTKNCHVKRFINEIGFIGQNDTVQDVNLNVESENDLDAPIFVPITQLRKIGTKRTYDIQVSDKKHLQNFVSNGFICHNSGKDFLTSIIALYETMRLLETPGGNPYAVYNLGMADPFTILTIANSAQQAKILFRQIKEKVLSSEYFRDKIIPEGVTSDAIHFLTPEDKKRNKELVEQGFQPSLGSVVVRAGHSNSDTLVGISCYVLLLDEIGLYKNTAGSSSGDSIFNSLAPAVKTYVRQVPKVNSMGLPILGPDGVQEVDKIYDGKIICLSTPRSKEGIFYNLFENHMEVDHRLVCRAATWQVNPMQSKKGLMAAFPSMPEEKFRMEFGAEFSGTAGENFFSEEDIEACFREKDLQLLKFGVRGQVYFAHLDPATSSHNYALILAHKEHWFDHDGSKKMEWRIIVDHIMYWSPAPERPISVEQVDEYVADLNSKFNMGIVTYDHFNSQTSIAKLRKRGIPTRMTPFTKQYKTLIYDNLYQLVIQRKLLIPHHLLLKNEMKNLQRKWLDNGYKVYAKKDGDVTTDDLCDALAGACYNCIEKGQNKYVEGKLVNSPVSNGMNDVVWRSMSGMPYGQGPGGQVARKLEQRSSAYPRR
jgi:intein/homing endonuclease